MPAPLVILAGIGAALLAINKAGTATEEESSGAAGSSDGGTNPSGPPSPPADPNCNALNAKLRKASERQYNVLVRMNRKFPQHFPNNWRCLTGGTSSGMESVFKRGMNSLGPGLVNLDPESWEALITAYGYTGEAFAQKFGGEVAKKALKDLQKAAEEAAKNPIGGAKEAVKKLF